MQVYIRKAQAGHASTGYTWASDGAVVAVELDHAAELLAIRDAGFEQVDPPDDDASDDTDGDDLDEVDRSPDTATDRLVKRGPGRPRKNP